MMHMIKMKGQDKMKTGYLVVYVYADNIAQPVKGAEVKITGNNVEMQLITDATGKTKSVALPAPDESYSLNPQSEVKPYAGYTLEVSKPGLNSVITQNVKIFDGETALQNVYLTSGGEVNYINLPEHVLWDNYPPKIIESDSKPEREDENRVQPFVFIPEYVIVHHGVPTNASATNFFVPFPDYIKNVASNEIYSTWPTETIKANVLAIISFTLNRVFTEWYTSKGYSFTITSSTAYDQAFVPNSTIYKSISDVVDQMFNQFLRLPNVKQPFFAQYNDGIKVNNKGWLNQWGSKSLGEQGYDAMRIIRYYYGSNMGVYTADQIAGLPTSFPGRTLLLGTCSQSVKKIQDEINTIAGNYPGIPKIIPADGQFKESTATSVKTFQKVFDLPQNGNIDFATWYKISYIYVAVTKMLAGIYS